MSDKGQATTSGSIRNTVCDGSWGLNLFLDQDDDASSPIG